MVRNARIKITIDGKLRPYTDGSWVVFDKTDFPVGFMRVDREHLKPWVSLENPWERLADAEKAFADFWEGSLTSPLGAALAGHRIELVDDLRMRELLARHVHTPPDQRPAIEGQLELSAKGEAT